ncbi:nuclear transport factor 2 family protein [Limnohabitans sp. Jir72]|uniref:nuclear transport factor 2 family protein n=1 Tax=Limnohabitans sp. Jir72 TaxID=1977909 RepID=UPI000D3C3253|nr:nuclear transport factor 2 family protein [Limnohabitans sp. Jir72]PUE33984.1 hypothetical protein B9Z52_07820 [Limnohabitans sp. Jir72]
MGKTSPTAAAGASLLLSIGLCFPSLGQPQTAQARPSPARQMPKQDTALTYNAHQYLQAEQALEEALSRNDAPTIAQLLAPNFTARTASMASLDKSDWLRQQAPRTRQPWIIRELTVQVQDDLRIVSFLRVNPQQASQQQLIVDIWREATRQLLNRYESTIGLGAPKPTPIRPDGKG